MRPTKNLTQGFRCLLAAGVSLGAPLLSLASIDIYVAPTGSDSANGATAQTPMLTLNGALAQVVRLRGFGNVATPATIHVASGRYQVSSAVALAPTHSNVTILGTSAASTILSGGTQVTGWTHFIGANMRRRVRAQTLNYLYSAPVSTANLGVMQRRGGNFTGATNLNLPAELLVDGIPMSLARYPATGWAKVTSTGADGRTLTLNGSRRTSAVSDAWVQGYWNSDYNMSWEPATSAPNPRTVAVAGINQSVAQNARVAVVNSLEDLSQPGQYYIDRTGGRVYFWPQKALVGSLTSLSQVNGDVLDMYQANNVVVKNLTIEASRGQGVRIYGCNNSGLDTCTVRGIQQEGVWLQGGTGAYLKNSTISDTGSCGIYAGAGLSATLTSGQVLIQNNLVERVGRNDQTYRPAIYVSGVGTTVSSNTITNCPHQAVVISGQNNLVTQNDISHTCQSVSDAGAIYTGQSITNRGNVVSLNIIHDIQPVITPINGNPQVVGIYMDDLVGGLTVQDNIISNVQTGVLIGGGRDNQVLGNAFNSVSIPVQIDARGKTWAAAYFSAGGSYQQQLQAIPPSMFSLFQSTYADFRDLVTAADPGLPAGNVVQNAYFPSAGLGVDYQDTTYTQPLLSVVACLYNGNTLFQNPGIGNYNLNAGVQVHTTLPSSAGETFSSVSVMGTRP